LNGKWCHHAINDINNQGNCPKIFVFHACILRSLLQIDASTTGNEYRMQRLKLG
jgi:hypothetical protein